LDNTFNTGTGANAAVNTIAQQADGKILIGGDITGFNGTSVNRIVRLNSNGSLDNTFYTGTGANAAVNTIVQQPDGKILIGGSFTRFNGVTVNHIARLNINGSLDNTFNPGSGASASVNTIVQQTDGKILIGGSFTRFNGVITANRIARLNSDASLDNTFNTGFGANSSVNTIV
jgi:uncharacterized delta-60 repeat protein